MTNELPEATRVRIRAHAQQLAALAPALTPEQRELVQGVFAAHDADAVEAQRRARLRRTATGNSVRT